MTCICNKTTCISKLIQCHLYPCKITYYIYEGLHKVTHICNNLPTSFNFLFFLFELVWTLDLWPYLLIASTLISLSLCCGENYDGASFIQFSIWYACDILILFQAFLLGLTIKRKEHIQGNSLVSRDSIMA